ncbi:hypothetical protein GJ496_005969 [Pomphorhynchus laevis]|nr:hypothetical protein GJ496_005969 [Pomphorhynchus laevis]
MGAVRVQPKITEPLESVDDTSEVKVPAEDILPDQKYGFAMNSQCLGNIHYSDDKNKISIKAIDTIAYDEEATTSNEALTEKFDRLGIGASSKRLGQALVRRRVSLLHQILEEYEIDAIIEKIESAQNKADVLSIIPKVWMNSTACCFASCDERLRTLRTHHENHHQGVERTLYLANRVFPDHKFRRSEAVEIIKLCDRYLRKDLSSICWETGHLEVLENWTRLALDITHYDNRPYMSLIDCGPSHFSVWKQLSNESSEFAAKAIEDIFFERGPPVELLKFGVDIRYICAYRPKGNEIVERLHRHVKLTASRASIRIEEAVYWHIVSPTDLKVSPSSPANQIYLYEFRLTVSDKQHESNTVVHDFSSGDAVHVRPPGPRCFTEWPMQAVTGAGDGLSVEVAGIPRHIADVRKATDCKNHSSMSISNANNYNEPHSLADADDDIRSDTQSEIIPRVQRKRNVPLYLRDYVMM